MRNLQSRAERRKSHRMERNFLYSGEIRIQHRSVSEKGCIKKRKMSAKGGFFLRSSGIDRKWQRKRGRKVAISDSGKRSGKWHQGERKATMLTPPPPYCGSSSHGGWSRGTTNKKIIGARDVCKSMRNKRHIFSVCNSTFDPRNSKKSPNHNFPSFLSKFSKNRGPKSCSQSGHGGSGGSRGNTAICTVCPPRPPGGAN